MANHWFKFYGGEYLSDPKILRLTAQERSCWITLLCLACQNDGQEIEFLSEKQLLSMSGVMEDLEVLKKFEDLKLITISNGNVTVKNWEKRQMSEGYSRVKNFRKRQSNANDNDRIEENRIEKKRIEEIELPIWLNKKAWDAWVKFRKELGKTLKPSTIRFQLKFLEKNEKDHTEIIRNSITNGWTGLFPIKTNLKGNGDHTRAYQKRTEEEIEERERKNNSQENENLRKLTNQSKILVNKMTLK